MLIGEALEAGRQQQHNQVVRGPILLAATYFPRGPERATSIIQPYISLLSKSSTHLPAYLSSSHRQAQIVNLTSRTSQNDAFGRLKACSQIGDLQHAV